MKNGPSGAGQSKRFDVPAVRPLQTIDSPNIDVSAAALRPSNRGFVFLERPKKLISPRRHRDCTESTEEKQRESFIVYAHLRLLQWAQKRLWNRSIGWIDLSEEGKVVAHFLNKDDLTSARCPAIAIPDISYTIMGIEFFAGDVLKDFSVVPFTQGLQ
jgi:hypothetical protein